MSRKIFDWIERHMCHLGFVTLNSCLHQFLFADTSGHVHQPPPPPKLKLSIIEADSIQHTIMRPTFDNNCTTW